MTLCIVHPYRGLNPLCSTETILRKASGSISAPDDGSATALGLNHYYFLTSSGGKSKITLCVFVKMQNNPKEWKL